MTDTAAQLAPDGRVLAPIGQVIADGAWKAVQENMGWRGRESYLNAQMHESLPDAVTAELEAHGYRIVPAAAADPETVTVSREDVESAVDAMSYVQDTYFWEKWGYQENYDRLNAALQQPAEKETTDV